MDALSQYKLVDSGGRHRNNVGGLVKDKYEFDLSYKFSIAFENSSYQEYLTEKYCRHLLQKQFQSIGDILK